MLRENVWWHSIPVHFIYVNVHPVRRNIVDQVGYVLKRISPHVFELNGIAHAPIKDFKVFDMLGREVPVTFQVKSANIISVEVHQQAPFIFSFSIDDLPYRLKVQ